MAQPATDTSLRKGSIKPGWLRMGRVGFCAMRRSPTGPVCLRLIVNWKGDQAMEEL